MKNSFITATDQFCGAGGSSIGATKAGVEIRLAMNHWKLAIETHNTNFPKVDHVCTDISATDPRRYPSTNILITSPECTNHSLAKGKPRRYYEKDLFGNVLIDPAEERSRATMWDVPRFAEYHDYEIIVVENVVDAANWRLWESWLHSMHALGYDHRVVYFNSMFAWPTPQSRDRMYTFFWKRGNRAPDLEFNPLAYCPRCSQDVKARQFFKKSAQWGHYEKQYFYVCPHHPPQNIRPGQKKKEWQAEWSITPYYFAAFNAIDWSIKAERIGDRKKSLKLKTLERIKYGLEAYGRKPLIVTGRYTTGVECRAGRQSVGVVAGFLSKQYGGNADPKSMGIGLNDPAGTITTWDHHALISVPQPFLVKTVRQQSQGDGIIGGVDPSSTQTTCQDLAVLLPSFVADLRGTSKASSLSEPFMCVTAGGNHHALLSPDAFLTYFYGGSYEASHITDPANTMTGHPRAGIVSALEALTVDDLTFRMLQAHEVGRIMAFDDDYVVLGNQREKVKQYGNAVTPPAMGMFIQRCVESLS